LQLKRSHLAREIVETIVLTLVIFIVIRLVVQSYHVEGPSMQPGLNSTDYVVVNQRAYLFHPPQRGDVIVFHYPKDPQNEDFIKRVIGLPGDTIKYDAQHVWVNGVLLNEQAYISSPSNPGAIAGEKVPPGEYFVLGDNRPVSSDSRIWGYVPKDLIVGKAVIIYWPISKWEFINTYSNVFTQIKASK